MKSYEAFSASVYAKAKIERRRIEQRNRRVRAASVSALCCLAIAAVAFRAPPPEQPRELPGLPQIGFGAVEQKFGSNALWALLYDAAGDDPVVVLNSPEEKKEFISNYKKDNNLSLDEELPVAPKRDAKTIHSAEELAEYLDTLPQDIGPLQKALLDYDEDFFSENDLQATPMEIKPRYQYEGAQSTQPKFTMPTIVWPKSTSAKTSTTTEPTEESLFLMPTVPTEDYTDPGDGDTAPPELTEPYSEPSGQPANETFQSEIYLLVLEPTKK